MNWIAWDDTLDTGHASMDTDHEELARLFDELRVCVESGGGKTSCIKQLDAIIAHTQAHFDRERELMAKFAYPKADPHEAEHAMLTRQALELRASVERDFIASQTTLAAFPDAWLAFHILFSDKELAAFLASASHDQADR
ncbi:MAG: bacteriohemerythrin [Burkholderiales bacterium]|nr:bacteriohemerythrin [Burkholderiales bacterium]